MGVDLIPQGKLWKSVADWHDVIPGFYSPARRVGEIDLETFGGEWKFILENQRGRLYVSTKHGRADRDNDELIVLQFTARGPVDTSKDQDWESGLEIGRQAIDLAFMDMTATEVQNKVWRRRTK